jgi:hypothetical protein
LIRGFGGLLSGGGEDAGEEESGGEARHGWGGNVMGGRDR